MRHRRDFLLVAILVTTWFALAQFPRVGMADHWGTSWKSGWPMLYEVWGERPDGVIYGREFRLRGLLTDVAVWLVLIAVVWYFTWPGPRRQKPPHPAAKV